MALTVPPGANIINATKLKPAGLYNIDYSPKYPLFSGDPSIGDIRQGQIGDCFFLSSLLSIILCDQYKAQYIKDMMLEEQSGTVIVRLYDPGSKSPVYFRTDKCRITEASGANPVSPRTCCWVDVVEACASHFDMSTNQTKGTQSIDRLNTGSPKVALEILLGKDSLGSPVPNPRKRDPDPTKSGFSYGSMDVIMDASIAPDAAFRLELIEKAFQPDQFLEHRFDSWTRTKPALFRDFIVNNRKAMPTNLTLAAQAKWLPEYGNRTLTASLFEKFLRDCVPQEFHAGLTRLVVDNKLINTGTKLVPAYPLAEVDMHEALRNINGCPLVAQTREYIGPPEPQLQGPAGEDVSKGLIALHCYTVTDVPAPAPSGWRWVSLVNPWGRYVRDYDAHTGKSLGAGINNIVGMGDGRFRVSIHDFVKKFSDYFYAQ